MGSIPTAPLHVKCYVSNVQSSFKEGQEDGGRKEDEFGRSERGHETGMRFCAGDVPDNEHGNTRARKDRRDNPVKLLSNDLMIDEKTLVGMILRVLLNDPPRIVRVKP